jgi:hypothetical protein
MEEICSVCGKPLDKMYAVTCIGCGGEIHFPSADTHENSCGSIVTQWNVCGLAFICKRCLAMQKPFGDVKTSA